MSKSAAVKSLNLQAQPLEQQPYDNQSFELTPPTGSANWKQEVNQRLAAHRTRRGEPQGATEQSRDDNPRSASSRAAEAAARVAARYAKAPSYKQLLAGEARAVVRAAGAAAEAARNAQAAAQAVLTGLEFGAPDQNPWEPALQNRAAVQAPIEQTNWAPVETQQAPARWLDEPPAVPLTAAEVAWREYEAIHGPQHMPTPRWEEPLPTTAVSTSRDEWSEMRLHPTPDESERYRKGHAAQDSQHHRRQNERPLDHDVASQNLHDPVSDATVEPVQHIAANLIEFPKELVAARKARPRLAEGPYYNAANESPQLSIFEVDPELLAPPIYLSDTAANVAPPEWASIKLDPPQTQYLSQQQEQADEVYADHEHTRAALHASYAERYQEPEQAPALPLDVEPEPQRKQASRTQQTAATAPKNYSDNSRDAWESIARLPDPIKAAVVVAPSAPLVVAPLSDRILAGIVDGALVTLAFLAAATLVIASTDHPPTGRVALAASVCGLMLFGMLYQFLFFSYAEEGTPGMRYARVALCSFEDDNPSREQMRKRIPALLLSTLPAGLGLAWAFIDGDSLALHDRLTKTYQRKY